MHLLGRAVDAAQVSGQVGYDGVARRIQHVLLLQQVQVPVVCSLQQGERGAVTTDALLDSRVDDSSRPSQEGGW